MTLIQSNTKATKQLASLLLVSALKVVQSRHLSRPLVLNDVLVLQTLYCAQPKDLGHFAKPVKTTHLVNAFDLSFVRRIKQ